MGSHSKCLPHCVGWAGTKPSKLIRFPLGEWQRPNYLHPHCCLQDLLWHGLSFGWDPGMESQNFVLTSRLNTCPKELLFSSSVSEICPWWSCTFIFQGLTLLTNQCGSHIALALCLSSGCQCWEYLLRHSISHRLAVRITWITYRVQWYSMYSKVRVSGSENKRLSWAGCGPAVSQAGGGIWPSSEDPRPHKLY